VTEEALATETSEAEPEAPAKRKPWYRRRTVRQLREDTGPTPKYKQKWEDDDNTETRLPETEAIHLGGIVLAEAFTPSTVSALYRTVERWPERASRAQARAARATHPEPQRE
jgi:hypothetical protein